MKIYLSMSIAVLISLSWAGGGAQGSGYVVAESSGGSESPETQPAGEPPLPELIFGPPPGPQQTHADLQLELIQKQIIDPMSQDAFTERDRQVLMNVREGVEPVQENGFYLMMGKIAHLPRINEAALTEFTRPSYHSLINNPDALKYHEVLGMRVRVFEVLKRSIANGLLTPHKKYWPVNSPVFEIWGTNADSTRHKEEPLCIYCPHLPLGLPEPSGKTEYKRTYRDGPVCTFAGVFYKVFADMQRGDIDDKRPAKMRTYPVILSWWAAAEEQEEAPPTPGEGMTGLQYGVVAIIFGVFIFGGLVLFFFLKKKVSTGRAGDRYLSSKYTPLRDTSHDDDMYGNGEVDADLAAAARAYRQEKHLDDPPEIPGAGG